jgi:hypothetical protein
MLTHVLCQMRKYLFCSVVTCVTNSTSLSHPLRLIPCMRNNYVSFRTCVNTTKAVTEVIIPYIVTLCKHFY